MGTIELDSKIKELRELRRMAEELQQEIDGITDTIKAEMTAQTGRPHGKKSPVTALTAQP